ncbi:MAG: hypothetical protein M3Y40_02720 [Chloroflexota bacterium]|nr:hypothetical protein [Chloroflexota bacterium]
MPRTRRVTVLLLAALAGTLGCRERSETRRPAAEVARGEDFRALGQEPGWELRISEGERIRFIYDYGSDTVTTPVPPRQRSPESGGFLYNAKSGSNHLQVVIEPSPCTDAMSGQPFETTVTVILNDKAYRGCGGPMPSSATPSAPRAAPRAD